MSPGWPAADVERSWSSPGCDDTVEDTAAIIPEIERPFGATVVRLLTCVTDTDGVKTWKERKKQMLKRFVDCSEDCLLLKCAGALDKVGSIRCDLERYADSIWRLSVQRRSCAGIIGVWQRCLCAA
jgi:hypothetical protein